MKVRSLLVLSLIGSLLAACGGNETKKEEAAPTATASAEAQAAKPAAKPACPPEPKAKATKKTTKSAAKKETPPRTDCEPAASAKPAAAPAAASKPAAAPAAEVTATSASGKACNPCTVKSRDGTYDGEIYGNIPPGSRWARLKIGMNQSEVESIIGVSHNVRAYATGKAFIPFYYGSDRHRYEVVYPGQGSVAYTGGSFGGGRGVLMMINYDAKIQ